MSLAPRLTAWLEAQGIAFEPIHHPATHTALTTARAAHVPGDALAKGVVLRDPYGLLVAVLPAAHRLDVDKVSACMGHPVALAGEADTEAAFPDCETGAVPACGAAYGLRTVWDAALAALPGVYLEAGDHRTVIAVQAAAFRRMMATGDRAEISHHI